MEAKSTKSESSNLSQGGEEVFVVGRGFSIVGQVRGNGLCIVEGSIDGSLETADVKINDGGSVNGELKCERLDVDGKVYGNIEAKDVILRSKAVVEGKLVYSTMAMKTGASIDGEMRRANPKINNEDLGGKTFFPLPANVVALMNSAKVKKLNSQNGDKAPYWITLEDGGISVSNSKLSEHKEKFDTLSLLLVIDDQSFPLDLFKKQP